MPRSLLFDDNNVATEVESGLPEITDDHTHLRWVNLRSGDDIRSVLPDIVDKSRGFTEDLLEEQRPRIAVYQTLEDNEDTFTVIVLALPTSKIFSEDNFQLQMTFVLLDEHIYSVGSAEFGLIPEIMAKIITKKKEHTLTSLFAFIVSELLETSIKTMNEVEDYIDYMEARQLKGGLEQGWLASLLTLKSRLFDANKMIRADLEHVREIKNGDVPELQGDEVGDQIEDRLLYLTDFVETLREELSNMINLNLAIASNSMNRQFYWLTIIGALLVIPTVISGIFGMNVDLPPIGFLDLIILIVVLTFLFGLLVRFLLPRPTFT